MVKYHPTRRELLQSVGHGFGALALSALLGKEGAAAPTSALHHPPNAKRVVQLFMAGLQATSTCSTTSRTPVKRHGEASDLASQSRRFRMDSGPWLADLELSSRTASAATAQRAGGGAR
jgi:hypothetical protein